MIDLRSQLTDIIRALDPDCFSVVGGLMVHLHSARVGLAVVRPTHDIDLIIRPERLTFNAAVRDLHRIGYEIREPVDPRANIHRLVRDDGALVDLMIPEETTASFMGRPLVCVPGSRSAMSRTVTVELGDVRVQIPDLGSALSLKGAASQIPSAAIGRHAIDGIVLFAVAAKSGEQLDLSKSMRANVNKLIGAMSRVEPWTDVPQAVAVLAVRGIQAVRPDWRPPVLLAAAHTSPRFTRSFEGPSL